MLFQCFVVSLCLCVNLLVASDKIVVGIAGGTGSGKTTLAQRILDIFKEDAILIDEDAYYKDLSHLPFEEREKVNFDHPDSLDFALLREHILQLKKEEPIEKPIYDFKTHTRGLQSQVVSSSQIIIIEGILLFSLPEIRELFDIKIFMDTADDVRLLRRIKRDMEERGRDLTSIHGQYLTSVKPMHDAFVGPSKQYADIIIPHGGENVKAIGVIVSKLKEGIQPADTLLAKNHLPKS